MFFSIVAFTLFFFQAYVLKEKSSSSFFILEMIYRTFQRVSTLQSRIYCLKRNIATASQDRLRNNLNVIDFYHPSLSPHTHRYMLQMGVSGYPKRNKAVQTQEGVFTSVQVGDDAYFQRQDALGVADGVGGWRTHAGANPALYSRKLMHYVQLELDRIKSNVRPQQPPVHPDPIQVLESAYNLTTLDAHNEGIVGSTTACIVILSQDELKIANIGDCGVSVIRKHNYVFRSEEQQHSFNFPYQLGTASFDSPQDAQQFTIKIEENDIIVLGSDGLFDNLFDEEILEEIKNSTEDPDSDNPIVQPQVVSDALLHRARVVSEDTDNPTSPFQVRAMHEGLYYQVFFFLITQIF
ncbi:phosphatase 2C-like domain-containing protein [Sporodiniella umbellata]|nr:phosphatase 2C-like domain-containing protein [Sporodiniella umbellata]